MEHMQYVKEVIRPEREEALRKAIDSLSRYKFQMFGYWAATWVNYNKLDPRPLPNPFADFVKLARAKKEAAIAVVGLVFPYSRSLCGISHQDRANSI